MNDEILKQKEASENEEAAATFLSTFEVGEMCAMDEDAAFGPVTGG